MTTTVEIPGYIAGTWTIDPVHSNASFTVRHMMVSKVRGHFNRFEGEIVTAPNPLDSRVTATIDLDSIDTGNPTRDDDMRSANYLEIETRSEEHTSELQSRPHLVCRLRLEKKKLTAGRVAFNLRRLLKRWLESDGSNR